MIHDTGNHPPSGTDFDWLLENFLTTVPGATQAHLTSVDGMRKASTDKENADGQSDRLSAISSGVQSLAKGASRDNDGNGKFNLVFMDLDIGYIFVMDAAPNTILTVRTDRDVDIAQVSYEMGRLGARLMEQFTTPERSTVPES